jgi:hypothetical protein
MCTCHYVGGVDIAFTQLALGKLILRISFFAIATTIVVVD